MSVTRKLASAAALATLATIGFASAANAQVPSLPTVDQPATAPEAKQVKTTDDTDASTPGKSGMHWYSVEDDGGLVSLDDNNVGPFQVCHNDVPVNGVGGQVPVSDAIGILGISSDGNTATLIKTCNQDSQQANDGQRQAKTTHWYRWNSDDELVSVDNNNLGPVQACHNNVPVNGVGGQVPIGDVTGILGISSDGNTATSIKTCEQQSQQHN